MENILKDLNVQIKVPYDGKAQNKMVLILNQLLEKLKTLDKKKLNEIQPTIEETMYILVTNNKGNNDLCNRFIFLIYRYIYENGLSSKINDFITKYLNLLQNSKLTNNIKGLVLWLLGKVCYKVQGKTTQLGDFVHILLKTIKNNNEVFNKLIKGFIRIESFRALYRILRLKQPSLHTSTNDIFKLILKQEKNPEGRKCVLKTLDACLFFFNSMNFQQHYESIVGFILKMFEDEDYKIRQQAIDIYVNTHYEKVFDQQINTSKIIKRKILEPSKNFLEIILTFGNFLISSKNETTNNLKSCLFKIIQILIEKNVEFINSQEKLSISIFDILIGYFPIQFNTIPTNFLNFRQNLLSLNKDNNKATSPPLVLNNHHDIEDLYKLYIRQIFTTNYRKNVLKYIYKRLIECQNDLDKIENFVSNIKKVPKTKTTKGEKESVEKYTEHQINAVLICLLEFSENNCDLFEHTFSNFQDLSQIIEVYLISSVKSFRIIMSRILVNFAYFIPSWRTHILTLILNLSSVAHAEVAALKNTFMYFVDENQPEYKYSLILRNNLDLLKDISNCLACILSVFSHKNYGIPVDLSNAALAIAKNMIIGKFADDEDNPKALSIKEKSKNYNTNSDVDAHKEAGWMIIQGLVSMDYTWLTNNFKTLFQLWKYAFAENSCLIEEGELQKPEYREALLSEFFIKKSALAALRKFILSSFDFTNAQSFQILIPKFLSNALNFFMPSDQKKTLYFFRQILKEKYKQAKIIFFDCYLSIPIQLYTNKFVPILHAVCDDVVAEYPDYTYEIILSNLNYFDTFLCERNFIYGPSFHDRQKGFELNNFIIDNFAIEKFNLTFTNQIAYDTNAKIVDSSVNLLVEILLDNNLNIKNRQQILKHFLSHLSNLNSKTKEQGKINKALNIVYALYVLFKKSYKRNTYVINDEHLFTNSKMIFDLGMSFELNLIRRISSEGHGLLISVSSNPTQNLDFYIKEFDCKIINAPLIDPTHTNNILFLIANIFRYNDFTQLSPILDNFMNIIFFFFNKSEDYCNQWFSQSILIICEVLIKNNQIEKCRKLIEVYKFNFLFINKDNHFYFKEVVERNSLVELKLLIIYSLIREIDANEIEMVKVVMNKYCLDEKYKYPGITRVFLYFAKNSLLNPKLKEHIHNSQLLQILLSILTASNPTKHTQINYLNDIEIKIVLQILIYYMLNMDKNIDSMKELCEFMVHRINTAFNDNQTFYFNSFIFNQVYMSLSTKDVIFEKNNEDNLIKLANLLDLDNKAYDKQKNIVFDLIYSKTLLIKLSKVIIKVFFEKKFNQYSLIVNFMKDLIQNQNSFYVSSKSNAKQVVNTNSDSLKSADDVNDSTGPIKSILSIRSMNRVLHLLVKKFLLKSLKTTLTLNLNLNTELKADNLKSQTGLIEFLNTYMNMSLLLISCEESWDIKFVGVKLLIETIKKFSNIKDFRMEDNSLLLQQYEAQINSCVKTLYNYPHSIIANFKAIKIYYYVLSIPITNDHTYIKKTINLVDINIKPSTSTQTAFSEKFDHLLICKKFNFYCHLYLSFLKYRKMVSISVINSSINPIPIFHENLDKTHIENFGEFFKSIYETFFTNIYLILLDCQIVLTQDKKTAKYYRNYNFITSGNRISYSYNKLLKYSQTYLKVLGFLANDTNFISRVFKDNQDLNKKLSTLDVSPIFYLIFYFLNHFSIKKLQPVNSDNETKVSEYIIYSENDITDELREKIILNSLMICEMIDNMICLLSSEMFSYNKKLFFEILKICVNLFTLSIDEMDCKLLNLYELLIVKFESFEKITPIEIGEKNQFYSSLGKFCLFYFNNKTFSNTEVETVIYSKMLELSNRLVLNIFDIKDSFDKETLNEYILGFMKIILTIFQNASNPNLFKLSASKLFNTILLIKETELLKKNLVTIKELLNTFLSNNSFEKFFTLYFTLLQYASKKFLEIKPTQEHNEDIILANNNLKELIDLTLKFLIILTTEIISKSQNTNFITKSMLLAFSSNNDQVFRKYFEHILYYIFDRDAIKLVVNDQDLQKLILTYIFNLGDHERVKIISNLIILKLNANFEVLEGNNTSIEKACMIIFQLMMKDVEFFQNVSRLLKRPLMEKIEMLVKAQNSIKQNQANSQNNSVNTESNLKAKEEHKSQEINQGIADTATNTGSSNTGGMSKLRALKFSK